MESILQIEVLSLKRVENIVVKGEIIGHCEQCLLLLQWFQKSSVADAQSKRLFTGKA